jgi:predicted amidohydrolase YtcJ
MLFGLALAAGSIAVAVADLVVRNARVYTVTALTRQGLSGGDPFVPEQAIDLATAIRAYTAGGAYANFCEHHRGSLAPGKAADLIALSGNLFELPPEGVKDCHVDLTMAGGQVHHRLW